MKPNRLILLAAAIAGLSGVILAAMGSHLVPGLDDLVLYKRWQAANHLHLLHAVVLLFLASRLRQTGDRIISLAALAVLLGIVLFCGSIYLSMMSSLTSATAAAPLGGMLLMLGWLLIAVHSFRRYGK